MKTAKPRETLYVLVIETPADLADAIASRLFDVGLQGLEEHASATGVRLLTYGDDRPAIERYAKTTRDYLVELAKIDPAARAATVRIDERPNDDWAVSWMKYFKQTALTERLAVQPSWDPAPPPAGMRRLIIEPKMAFGFGTHATTQLAARSVERWCLAHPGGAVLDVGTGTGILALAALLSGAARAVGVDIDPAAVAAARENAALNGLEAAAEFTHRPLHQIRGEFDLVAANITAPTLLEMAGDLTRRTKPGGRLALTGVLAESRREMIAAYDERGMSLAREEEQDEWILLELEHA
jgi:ribosomal protein L11 methyltransferase